MKKITLLSIFCLSLLLCACGKKNADSTEPVSIVGTWTQTDANEDSYFVLELKEDSSGSLMTEPEDIGIPLDYEFDGSSIMTHMGSVDDNTPMEYDNENDQIKYGDIIFIRK